MELEAKFIVKNLALFDENYRTIYNKKHQLFATIENSVWDFPELVGTKFFLFIFGLDYLYIVTFAFSRTLLC